MKSRVNYGGEGYAGTQNAADQNTQRFHQHFGLVVASCTGADLRPSAKGVHVYADAERRFEPLASPRIYRDEVIDEFYDAIVDGAPVVHSGEWGMATMEVCLAMLASHREGRDIALHHQIALEGATA